MVILLIAFILPLNKKIIPILIATWFFLWLIRGGLKMKILSLKKNSLFLVAILFYLLHIAGMANTENTAAGWFDLEVKFSLFLLPILIFSDKKFLGKERKWIFGIFVLGNLVAAVLCFGYALYMTINLGENYFHYSFISIFLHSSYSSLFALFAICIIIIMTIWDLPMKFNLYTIRTPRSILRKNFHLNLIVMIGILLLFVFILVTQSRAGIITSAIVFCFLISYYFIRQKKLLYLFVLLGIFFCSAMFAIQYMPRFNPVISFMNTKLDSTSVLSTENVIIRYLIFQQSAEIISENIFIGVGTGDVKDALVEKYTAKNMIVAREKKLNSHNQFQETFIGLGLPGFICLMILILFPLIKGIKEGNVLNISFSIIILVNFLFESMLNTQSGVIFFSFFNSLFCFNESSKRNDNE